jgi:tetratricopeptide (TPR) repeat protein
MNVNLERAWLLIQASLYSQAEEELRLKLAVEPTNCLAHLLLCQCLIEQNKYQEAIKASDFLICIAPDYAHAYYSKGFISYNYYLKHPRKKSERLLLNKAERAVKKAIKLSPQIADYWTLLAAILFEEGYAARSLVSRDVREILAGEKIYYLYWTEALEAIEQALKLEPDSIECIHLQALILNKLNRKEQAKLTLFRQTLKLSLFERQQHPGTHVYLGWFLLDENNHKQALEHFIFAFKLSKEPEKARLGIIEALKRQHFIYRLLSPTTKTGRKFWFGSIGIFCLLTIASLFKFTQALVPSWLLSMVIGYVILISVFPLLFNSVLKLKKYEQKFLSTTELIISHFLAGVVVVIFCIMSAIEIYPSGNRTIPLILTLVSSSLLIPLAVMQAYSFGKQKRRMTKYTLCMSIFAMLGLTLFTNLPYMSGSVAMVAAFLSCLYCSISTVGSFLSYHVATNLTNNISDLWNKTFPSKKQL